MFFIKLQSKIASSLSKEVIIQRLNEVTNTIDDDLFVGHINDKGFNIHKKPKENVRNAFMPVFVGTIEENSNGCTVNITARFNLFVAVFMTIWSLGAVVLPLIIGFAEPMFFLMPLAVVVIFVPLLYFAFYKPAKKSLRFLSSILSK